MRNKKYKHLFDFFAKPLDFRETMRYNDIVELKKRGNEVGRYGSEKDGGGGRARTRNG